MSVAPRVDLSAAKAKVAHARRHFETLQSETDRIHKEHKPYSLRWGQVDKQTGWVSVFFALEPLPANDLGLYAGDVAHNLRCALDCLTVALAKDCGAPIKNQQFPIYDSAERYLADLGTCSEPKTKSRLLAGITDPSALELFESLQPYHRDGDAHDHPLWHIYRFSSTHRHGQIACDFTKLKRAGLKVRAGTVTEVWKNPVPPTWPPEAEYEFRRLRFAKPFPARFEIDGAISTAPRFVIPPDGPSTEPAALVAIAPAKLKECCDHAEDIIGRFERL